MTDEKDEAAIRALFQTYGAAFDDADAEAVAELFAFPAVIWQLGEGHVFEDAEDLSENIEALFEVFDEAGIVLTTPEVRDIRIGGVAAFATVFWRQEDEAGESLHEFTCHYMLVRDDGAWRLATVYNEEESVTH
jgi:uncharacterized protein (TIGR02246 family)